MMEGMEEQNNNGTVAQVADTLPVNTTDTFVETKGEELGNDPRFAWDLSILTVPSDTLKRVTRERKYVIESIQDSVALLNDARDGGMPGAVERVLARLKEQRGRLTEIGMEEKKYLDQCRSRVGYLLRMKKPQTMKDMSYVEWNAGERFQLLLQEYIARLGYEKSLECMLRQSSVGKHEAAMLLDVHAFKEMQELVVSLEENCCCRAALAWCNDHQAKLKKLKSSLPFHLHVQEFLQLLFRQPGTSPWKQRQKNAIDYAKKYVAPYASVHPSEFQQAAATLVLASPHLGGPRVSPKEGWADLVRQMRREYFRIHGLPLISPLEIHLQAGIAALKTPQGMQGLGGEGNPLGHPALCRIAERLPYSKRTVSKLVCPITGKIMEGSNAPLVLPNGYVYGEDAIRAGFLSLDNAQSTLGASGDDYPIQCPITKDIFSIKDARRAYIV